MVAKETPAAATPAAQPSEPEYVILRTKGFLDVFQGNGHFPDVTQEGTRMTKEEASAALGAASYVGKKDSIEVLDA